MKDKPDAEPVPLPAPSEADRLVDAWLIDHFGIANPQFLSAAAKEDLKFRVRAALEVRP